MTECSICADTFNKCSRLQCRCPHCDFASCRKCIQSYILTVEDYTISCMSCKKAWTTDTLDCFITAVFRNNELKKHRQKILMDRETSLLPATQSEVLRAKEMDECKRLACMYRQEITDCKKKLIQTYVRMNQVYRNSAEMKTEKVHFSIHCPFKSCKGFVKSDTWQCGLCEKNVCNKCHECIIDDGEEHECSEDNLKTAQMIKKETKSCPGCSTLIFKISGCNQMWCTQCHTTFSWDTGKIVNGRNVHNPHFYEWIRNNQNGHAAPRVMGDIPCGGILSIIELRRIISKKPAVETVHIYHVHREVLHIQAEVLPNYQTDQVQNNLDIRIKFLMDKIDEDEFKILLQQREKKMVRNREVREVLEMYVFTLIDMFNNLQSDFTKIYPTFETELNLLIGFANDQLAKISKRYKSSVPFIGNLDVPTIRY